MRTACCAARSKIQWLDIAQTLSITAHAAEPRQQVSEMLRHTGSMLTSICGNLLPAGKTRVTAIIRFSGWWMQLMQRPAAMHAVGDH